MKLLKKALIASLVILFLVSSMNQISIAAEPILDAQDVEQFIDTYMQHQLESLNIPNATVAVVAHGEVILSKGYGYSNIEAQTPVNPNHTLFRVGSTSKLVTWTAVMQLVEQGKLDLDTDVNEYIDFEIPAKLYTQRTVELNPITLRHLMSHTPGFEDYSSEIFKISADKHLSLAEYIREYLPARVFPAGEVIAYSNYGTALAGYIVEQVSGMPFSDYVEAYIYAPLEMENSTFRQPLPDNLRPNMAKAYRFVNGGFLEGEFEYMPEPAGSMSSTAKDMAHFMLAYLQGGQYNGARILEEQTVDIMFSQLFTHHTKLNGMAHGFIEGTFNDIRTLFHPGSTMLFDTGLYLLPEKQIGIFVSHSGGTHLVNTELFQAFLDRYFPAEHVIAHSPTEGIVERSSQYVGEYHQNRRSLTTSDKMLSLIMGTIHVTLDDEGYLLVTHIGETDRFIEVEPGVYHNLREGRSQDFAGDFRTIVFGKDPLGKTLLLTDGPMSYSKAAWYETSLFNILLLVLSILIIIGSLIYWGVKWIIQKLRRTTQVHSKAAKSAKWLAIAYGFLTIAFVFEFMIVGEPHPIYQLPTTAFSAVPNWTAILAFVPILMAINGLVIVVFAVIAWWKRLWHIAGRIHYSLFTGATLMLLWIFSYWNII